MEKDKLNKFIKLNFSENINNEKLDNLEFDVINRITNIENNINVAFIDKIFSFFTIPQFQMLSIIFALFIGIASSSFIPKHENFFVLNEFSANAPHLSLNLSKELI